ncbi:MAG TPA: hypothetical protein VF516_26715 [Kofleriaceae bacterium]
MRLRARARLVAGAGVVLAGCLYTEPINRQPKVFPPQRLCDAAHPADPCSPDNLHRGDHVMVKAVFHDPDGDPNDGTVQWRISACDGPDATCDVNRLYDQMVPAQPPYPEFTVPAVLTGTEVPTRNIVFEITVFDDRGASSTGEDSWNVIPDAPAAAQEGSGAGTP